MRLRTVLLAALAVVPLAARAAQEPRVSILSPAPDAIVTGTVTLTGSVDPATAMVNARFFVDGAEVCVVRQAPIQCVWEAPRPAAEHQVRLAVEMEGGRRLFTSVRTGAPTPTFRSRTEAVQVTVTVNDSHGQYARDIPQTAFHIFEDGKAQTVQGFASENVPLELVLALDISASMAPSLSTLKAAVKDFLSAVPPEHHVSIIAFNGRVYPVARRSSAPSTRAAAVDALTAWGETALYDAITEGLSMLAQESGRKALLVFTDGEDQGSHTSRAEVERALEASDATLYSIGHGAGTSADALKKLLARLSEPTGGRLLFADNLSRLHDAFGDMLRELSNQYLLGCESTNRTHDGSWREIKVSVDGFSRVRARNGYRAPER